MTDYYHDARREVFRLFQQALEPAGRACYVIGFDAASQVSSCGS